MKHEWNLGWKEHKLRRLFIDTCKKCGVLRANGATTLYIPQEQAKLFLTTNKRIDCFEYIGCLSNFDKGGELCAPLNQKHSSD